MARKKRPTYSAWFIVDDDLVLCRVKHQVLKPRTKRGIPMHAEGYDTEHEAQMELSFMREWGFFPLFVHGARVERLTWS